MIELKLQTMQLTTLFSCEYKDWNRCVKLPVIGHTIPDIIVHTNVIRIGFVGIKLQLGSAQLSKSS